MFFCSIRAGNPIQSRCKLDTVAHSMIRLLLSMKYFGFVEMFIV